MKPLREALGNEGVDYLELFLGEHDVPALLAIWFFYKSAQHSGEGKTFGQILERLDQSLQ